MKVEWNDETKPVYEACVWVDGNINLIEGDFYTTKAEAVNAVKTCKRNYKGNGELDCFVRYHDYEVGEVIDYVNL